MPQSRRRVFLFHVAGDRGGVAGGPCACYDGLFRGIRFSERMIVSYELTSGKRESTSSPFISTKIDKRKNCN